MTIWDRAGEIASRAPGEAAEQPEGDGRQLVVGVGQDLQERDDRAGEGAYDHAGQHQDQNGIAPARGCGHEVDQSHGDQAADEGQQLDTQDRQRQEDAEHGPKPGTRRYAQDVGRHQWVAKKALVGSAGRRQGAANQDGGADAGQADPEEHGVDGGAGRMGAVLSSRARTAPATWARRKRVWPNQGRGQRQDDEYGQEAGDEQPVQGPAPPSAPSSRPRAASSSSN